MATAIDLPKEFDVIVLGTGMPESIVAAAFSRIGQSVLHLDRNDHYSGNWASFNLQGIEKWTQQHQDITCDRSSLQRITDESSLLEDGECLVQLPLDNASFCNSEMTYYVQEQDEDDLKVLVEKSDKTTAEIVQPANENVDKRAENISDVTSNEDKNSSSPSADGEIEKPNEVNTVDDEEGASKTDEDSKDTQLETNTDTAKADNKPDVIQENAISANQSNSTENDAKCEEPVKKTMKSWSQKRLKEEWRRFNLDLSPKVLYSVGDMVELLISSDIAKYCEFKTVTQVLTLMDGNLEKVPCSRADVFSSKRVSMLEKRMLMKFLQFCLNYENKPDEIKDYMDKPFIEFLTSRKLTPNIKHYIQHSIAMATDSMTTAEGLTRMKRFLSSLGRYGNTAFLWSLYGSGELPQSFCRMCAVFGGVYCLKMSASSLIIDSENRCTAVITTEGQRIKCKWLVMESTYAPTNYLDVETQENRFMSRAVFMTDRPLLTTGQQEQLSLMCLPCPDDGDRPVNILELPPSSMASPSGVYICHLTRLSKKGLRPKDDLSYAVNSLFTDEENSDGTKPRLLWSLYFTQEDLSQITASSTVPDNVILMSGPGSCIDIDNTVQEAKDVFKRILPEEEFLPKAPNPEDIIYVDDSEAPIADADSQSEFSNTDQLGAELQEEKTKDQLDCKKQEDNLATKSDEITKPEQKSENPEQETGFSATEINDVKSSSSQVDLKEDCVNDG